jgi:SNF2 family DNA or RNA helicase
MTNFSIPLIIFGSKPAILSWIRQELPKWLSDKLKQYIFLIDSSVSASDVVNRLKKAKIVLINYEAVGKFREEIEVWCRKHVPFGILDEGHRLKNYNSKKTQVMMWLRDKLRHLLILTATPNPNDKMGEIQNDLITMINLAIPFTSRNAYSDEIVAKDAFRNMMTRSSALPEEIVKGPIYVDMHPIHRKIYLEYIASPQMVAKISNYVRQNDWFNAHVCLTHILIYNACPSSPLLIQALKNNSDIPKQVINYLENNGPGAKIEWTINQVKELVEKKKKVIVWSAWNDVLHTIKVILEDCGIKSVVYNGEVDRDLALENFKKPENMVLLGNIGCGEAVSFHQEAQHAIFNDHNYNACHLMQAKNRHRRKGMPSGTIATTYYVYSQIDSNEEYSIDYSVRNNIISKTDNLDDIFGQEEIDSNEDQENDTNKLVGADEERRKQKYEDIIDNISKPFLDRGIDIPKQTDDLIFNKTKNEPKQPRDVGT